jgi:hypothetical protein
LNFHSFLAYNEQCKKKKKTDQVLDLQQWAYKTLARIAGWRSHSRKVQGSQTEMQEIEMKMQKIQESLGNIILHEGQDGVGTSPHQYWKDILVSAAQIENTLDSLSFNQSIINQLKFYT